MDPQSSTQLYPGLRVGSVELVTEVEPRDSIEGSQHYRQWEVLCDCGGRAYRTVANLVRAIKLDQDTCCERCLQELRRGLYAQHVESSIQAGRSRTSLLAKWFKKTGSLYPGHYYERINYESTLDLDTFQVDSFSLPCCTYETEPGSVNPDYPQQDQWLVQLKGVAGWICYHCETPFTKGCGCVRCLTRICESCKNTGAHCCPTNWMGTWKNETKDPGLLDRRIKLLKLKSLKLTTKKDIEEAKKAYRDSYLQWKWEQQQEVIRELKAHAEQQKRAALERRRAELLAKAKRRAEKEEAGIARRLARAKEKEISKEEKRRLDREKVRKGMHVKSLPTRRRLLAPEFWGDP